MLLPRAEEPLSIASSRIFNRWPLLVLAVSLACCLIVRLGHAQEQERDQLDSVVLRLSERSRGTTTIRGKILDYTNGVLTLELAERKVVRSFAAKNIVKVETPLTESHIAALAHFSAGEISSARNELLRADKDETRRWVRNDILALLIRCDLREGNRVSAASRFIELVDADPQTRHFHLIPLTWLPGQPTQPALARARNWLALDEPVPRLLGASLLLNFPDAKALVKNELTSLKRCGNRAVEGLAECQLWRLRLLEGELRPVEITLWISHVRRLPEQLRGGPYYLLGRAHLRRAEFEEAAMAMLRVPFTHADDLYFAARAQLEAAQALNETGRVDKAVLLFHEVSTRFSTTPFAKEAADILSQMQVRKSP